MALIVPNKNMESGVFMGTPDFHNEKNPAIKPLRIIRTMKTDMAEAIKTQNETSVSIAIAEEKKRALEQTKKLDAERTSQSENSSPAPKRVGRFVIIMILLLIVSTLGLLYVYVLPKLGGLTLPSITLPSFPSFGKSQATATTTIEKPITILVPSIIPSQSEKQFEIAGKSLVQILTEIGDEIHISIPIGSIKNFYFTETTSGASAQIPIERLLNLANLQAPDILLRSLRQNFMLGILEETNSSATPFLILKVTDHDTGLAGMLDWEQSLVQFVNSNLVTNKTSAPIKNFRDIIVSEKNARALDLSSGAQIVYAFAGTNTIVITGSISSLKTLLPLASTPTSR